MTPAAAQMPPNRTRTVPGPIASARTPETAMEAAMAPNTFDSVCSRAAPPRKGALTSSQSNLQMT